MDCIPNHPMNDGWKLVNCIRASLGACACQEQKNVTQELAIPTFVLPSQTKACFLSCFFQSIQLELSASLLCGTITFHAAHHIPLQCIVTAAQS